MSGRALSRSEIVANIAFGRENLLWYMSHETEQDRLESVYWYPFVNHKAMQIANQYGIQHDTVIRIIAALSPQLPWSQNLYAAESVIRYYIAGGYIPEFSRYPAEKLVALSSEVNLPLACNCTGPNKLKALWICQGYSQALSGPKVESFYHNIKHTTSSGRVTVDTHAINAWRKAHETPESVTVSNDADYRLIEADYIAVAEILGCTPEEAQARIWVIYRRLSGAAKKTASLASGAEMLELVAFCRAMAGDTE